MKLQIRVDDDGNIVDSCFKTFGCGSAIASSSVVTEWVKGQHIDEAVTIKNNEIAKHLNLPPVKLHCSMLAEDAIKDDCKATIRCYPFKHNQTPPADGVRCFYSGEQATHYAIFARAF